MKSEPSDEEILLFFLYASPVDEPATTQGITYAMGNNTDRMLKTLARACTQGLVTWVNGGEYDHYGLSEAGVARARALNLTKIAISFLKRWPFYQRPPVWVDGTGRVPLVMVGGYPFFEATTLGMALGYTRAGRAVLPVVKGLDLPAAIFVPDFHIACKVGSLVQVPHGQVYLLTLEGASAVADRCRRRDGVIQVAMGMARAFDRKMAVLRQGGATRWEAGGQVREIAFPLAPAGAIAQGAIPSPAPAASPPVVAPAPAPEPQPAPPTDRLGIERQAFEGKGVMKLTIGGVDCWIASEVGRALEYGGEGKGLVKQVGHEWTEEFLEGEHVVVAKGEILKAIQDAVLQFGPAELQNPKIRHLTLLTRAGLWLVLAKTEKPVGVRFRRWLTGEVREAAEQGRPVETGMNGEELPARVPEQDQTELPLRLPHSRPARELTANRPKSMVREYVDRALLDPRYTHWTDFRIADAVGTDHHTVKRRRQALIAAGRLPGPGPRPAA